MLWCLIKTWVGKEEGLVEEIRRTVPLHMYEECFVIYQERIWRRQQRSIVHMESLFPGCAFLTCKDPESVYTRLSQVPAVSRLVNCKNVTILPMIKEDADFLEKISGEDHVVRLSYVLKDEQGQICKMTDPLRSCEGQIERYQFKKRYAMVRHRLGGEDRAIAMGIILKEDAEKKLLYENMEVSVEVPR